MRYDKTIQREAPEMVEVEAILLQKQSHAFLIKLDEDARPIKIPRTGVKTKTNPTGYTTFTMTEDRAITFNLI